MSESVESTIGWRFAQSDPTAPRYGGDPAEFALRPTLDTFVREVLQNSNDQQKEESTPVEVRFKIDTLQGKDLKDFFAAFRWSDLRRHLKAVPEKRAKGIHEFVQHLVDEKRLMLVTVEDRHTQGLTGNDDDEESNYTALVRDTLYSLKPEATAGGSYGLGKAVLWAFSGVSTVVFHSTIHDSSGQLRRRLIARAQLPTHGESRTIFQGPGWLGAVGEGRKTVMPPSIWDEEAMTLSRLLRVERPEVPGTSVSIVGFRAPAGDEWESAEELAKSISEAAILWFWPAMQAGRLKVEVHTDRGVVVVDPSRSPIVSPFAKCLEAKSRTGKDLKLPGDTIVHDLPMEIPPLKDGTGSRAGAVSLAVRLAELEDHEMYRNHVALFRGAGMVVQYVDLGSQVFGGRDFYGALLCGRARPWGREAPTEGDMNIDQFLRAAEPPSHNSWEATRHLKEDYARGGPATIDRLRKDLRDAIRKLVNRGAAAGEEGPQRLSRLFPLGPRRGPEETEPGDPLIRGSTAIRFDPTTDSWNFEIDVEQVKPLRSDWIVDLQVRRMAEDGPTKDLIPIAEVNTDSKDASVDLTGSKAAIHVGAEVRSLRVRGRTTRDEKRGRTRLEADAVVRTESEPL